MSRWLPALAMLAVSFISYLDRNTLAILAPVILQETGLTAEQYGYIVAAFSIAYSLANPAWGRILDRHGLRRGMTWAVGWWTLASVAHTAATGLWSFAAARAALGLGEGATFPGGLRTVVQTLPEDRRGRGLAVAYGGGSLGAIVAPLIVTPIFQWGGWRAAFWFTGAVGLAWIVFWNTIAGRARFAYIEKRSSTPGRGPSVGDRDVWALVCAYALGALPLGFVIYAAALFLAKSMHYKQEYIGKVLWIPPLGWELGYFLWGWAADRRKLSPITLMLICTALMLPLCAVPSLTNGAGVLALLFVAMFAGSGFIVLSVAHANSIYSPDFSGLIAGVGAGSWSALVALTMPWFGRLFDRQQYSLAFQLVALFPVAGCAGWWILSRKSLRNSQKFRWY